MADGAVIVDARGHHCPVPSLRLRRALEAAAPGTMVTLLADDPMARIDVPHLLSALGDELLSTEAEGVQLAFTVRKGGQPGTG